MSSVATTDAPAARTDEPGGASEVRHGKLEYLGGLDGLRAAAVVVVMIGHMPYKSDISLTYLNGSYLGVSTFFTLSGFLITRLLLAESQQRARVDLKEFWTRRAKRLLPALYVCIAAAMLLAMLDISIREVDLGRQIVWTLLYFKNGYHLYLGGSLGAALFPLWSLSIEEQFYLVFPLLFVGCMRWLGRRAVWVFGALFAASYLVMRSISVRGTYNGWTTAYYSTPTRAAEILAGVLLAYATTSGWFVRARAHRWFTPAAQTIGAVGGIGLLWTWQMGGVRWDNLHKWTLLCSLATICLIIACLSRGPVTWALELRPIRWMGRVSYGAYLYQLLVFFCVTADTTGIHNTRVLIFVRIAAVFAVAGLSHRFIEAPLRHRREPRGRRLVLVYGGVAVTLAALALTLPFPQAGTFKVRRGPFAQSNDSAKFDATRIQVTGDQRMADSIAPLVDVAREASGRYWVVTHTGPVCPVVPAPAYVVDGRLRRPQLRCQSVRAGLIAAGRDRPDVVVLSFGLGDLLDWVSADGEVNHLGSERGDALMELRIQRYLNFYKWGRPSAKVAWLLLPEDPSIVDRADLTTTGPVKDPSPAARAAAERVGRLSDGEILSRIERWNELVRKVARTRKNVVVVDHFEPTADGWRTLLEDPRLQR